MIIMAMKMDDIARIANVSRSAVSLALNGKDGVSEETRAKIFKVIDEYNYKPLRKNKKSGHQELANVNLLAIKSSGLISNNYRSLPFFDSLISSLSERISSSGGTLQINTIDAATLKQSLKDLPISSGSTGTIVLATDLTESQVRLIQSELDNVVFIDTYYHNIKADFVTMDNYQGAFDAGMFMLEKGYKKIGYVASDKLVSNFKMRRQGFKDALETQNLEISNQNFYTVSPTELNPRGLNIHQIIDQNAPEAIFCEDDYIATRLIKGCLNAGINIPTDLGIMGFDDIYEGTLLTPELTTVHVPIQQITNQTIRQLQGQVFEKEWAHQKTLISTSVIIRGSL
ncbi:LacI family DNA-binding transcriptional regulator [Lactiplantibacillus plantarum]|uniref:LacI family DNA-binding transcriptional regulator n=4 Tax=Lactiplantibacillus plantarum TaxID=1590 RepID=UPI001CFE0A98|nr:LacI family DNA-binding transcriptional regulator [Lactiplantibacillus plantarum]GJI54577.1 LacI family DNA-binding transcriptional regulator [Lactiplantibacillus plantarum]